MHWSNACEFHNSVPVLLSPFLGWVAYCFLQEKKFQSYCTIYLIVAAEKPEYPVKKNFKEFVATKSSLYLLPILYYRVIT